MTLGRIVKPSSPSSGSQLDQSEVARYGRHLVLPEVGPEGQLRLRAASVLIVGAGGLGSPLALYGSSGYLEIAYNGDSAEKRLDMGVGIIVNVAVEPMEA